MPSHVRNQIRDAVVGLIDDLTTTGPNVYLKPAWRRPDGQLPALEVMTTTDNVVEDMSSRTSSGINYMRSLVVRIEAIAKSSEDVQGVLDTIALEVETALYADQKLGGLAKAIDRIESEQELSDEGESPVGRLTVDVTYLYQIRGGAPQTAL